MDAPPPRRRRARGARVRLVVLLIAVANIFGGLLASVLSLRHDADDARHARVLLAQLDTAATELADRRAGCGAARTGESSTAASGTGADGTGADGAGAACRAGAEQARTLRTLLDQTTPLLRRDAGLPALTQQLEAAPTAGDRAGAQAWLQGVREVTADISRRQDRSAGRTSALADAETGLLMIISLAVAVTLFRRFDAARRQGELRAAAERARSEARFRALVTHASDLILVCDEDGTVRYHSPSTEQLALPAEGEVRLADLVHPEDLAGFGEALAGVLAGGVGQLRHTARWRRRDGGLAWIEAVVSDLRGEPDVAGLVLNGHDVTDARELEDQLRRQAFTDPLTELANRALFTDRVEHSLLRSDGRTALLYLDLDRFKAVNDTRGHAAGDAVLVAVAGQLHALVRPGDTVARLGGDEFAVLLEPDPDGSGPDPERVAGRVLEALAALDVQVSIGIAGAGDGVRDADDLLRRGDLAMYAAKGAGGHRWVRFQEDLHAARLDRMALAADLAGAADRGELRALYQPLVDLADGRLLGVEALVRWEHPERGLLGPLQFIPIAEETGLILQVGRWILRTACAQVRSWQQELPAPGRTPLRLSVNVSTCQLLDPNLVQEVREILAETGFPPTSLTLEVTETQLVADIAGATAVLDDLRGLGCAVAIDDFGTGYSSLSYLEQLPIDTLKIDRSFVQRLSSSDEARVLVASIVTMARGLGMQLVAEGVEELAQASELARLDCQVGQGFLWAKPVPATGVEAMLRGGGYLAAGDADGHQDHQRTAGGVPAAAQQAAGVPTPRRPGSPADRTAGR